MRAYANIAKVNLTPIQEKELKLKLRERQAKEEINNVLITPEEIGKEFLPFGSSLQQAFAKVFQGELVS